ncbi:hypothetical protein [Botrimarina mediterranea]|uniref:Uncharacterized protein n=1 Tax=Botrimarina mediterranea TaxID=2528022 RepID=A0A518KCG1_9BACT|nr:hypothetical protein [Botrimarina mediterranea]QDV75492.1 hypothetical protein Spa11_37100 [Botrimarina mediterranea]QDV80125.1 hypothetical protein K2D_37490 [Planctomycetes bacterium K2D]
MNTIARFAPVALAVLAAASTGCKSGGGSRWAWNPWSKPAAEAEALAATDAQLPSSGATPQVETLGAKAAPTAVATSTKTTPPALEGVAPKFEAVAAAAPTPTINKPAPTSPNWSPYPTSPSSNPAGAAAKTIASTPVTPAAAKSAAPAGTSGPYNPNGYKPQVAAATTAAGEDRYGITPTTPLPDLKSNATTTAQTAQQAADRYAASTAAAASNWFDAVDSSAPAKAMASAAEKSPTAASPFPTTSPTSTAPTATSTYPSTGSVATAAPAASPYPSTSSAASPYPTTVGALPPATTPIASTTPAENGSVIKLTSAPGGYRPGGTSTYPTSVSVATRPTESTTKPEAPASTTPSRY